MEKVKKSPGYLKAKNQVEKFLKKSTVKHNYCYVTDKKSEHSFYCYSYKIASELSDYLEKSKGLNRIKSNDEFDRNFYKYIVILNK